MNYTGVASPESASTLLERRKNITQTGLHRYTQSVMGRPVHTCGMAMF